MAINNVRRQQITPCVIASFPENLVILSSLAAGEVLVNSRKSASYCGSARAGFRALDRNLIGTKVTSENKLSNSIIYILVQLITAGFSLSQRVSVR
jgi:hypothetical protein